MTQREGSDSGAVRVVVINATEHTWEYVHDHDYVKVYGGAGLKIEVGFDGISEDAQHSIELPKAVAEHLEAWLRGRRR